MKRILFWPTFTCVFFLFGIGCLFQGKKKDEWKPIKQRVAPVVHTVQWPEEKLVVIAKWYTGAGENWEALADANPNINRDSLSQGVAIFVPAELVKNPEPMPKAFLKNYIRKDKKKRAESKKPSSPAKKEEIDFDVFGPK